MNYREIIVLPAPGCRRSLRIVEYLERQGIPFCRVELDSPEGREPVARYGFRASPGILVDGISVNPFNLLIQPACRVDEEKARTILMAGHTDELK
jgi:glutaredoxin